MADNIFSFKSKDKKIAPFELKDLTGKNAWKN